MTDETSQSQSNKTADVAADNPLKTWGTIFSFGQVEDDGWGSLPWADEGMAPCDWMDRYLPAYMRPVDAVLQAARPFSFDDDYPMNAGLYFLVASGRVIYVGISNCIGRRLEQHWKNGFVWDRLATITGLPKMAIEDLEAAYIHAFEPPLNRKYPVIKSGAKACLKAYRKGIVTV